jgi:outer membrane biosynthesis protein TonB
MATETIDPGSESLLAISEAGNVLAAARDRRFQIGLACAFLLHTAVLIGAIKLPGRHIGDESGVEKALSVEIVSAADLESKTTAPVDPPSPPPAPPPVQAQAQPQQPVLPKDTLAAEQKPAPAEPEKADVSSVLEALKGTQPDLLSIEPGAGKPAAKSDAAKNTTKPPTKPETKPETKERPKTETKKDARAEPDRPLDTRISPSSLTGRSASFVRPPGITRSGLNDQFARNVIRALQQTMPRLDGALGRATIRILLDTNGNIANVELVVPGKDPIISQSVAFAARQTSFPIPPGGSTVADRTFLITYIYE